ncbi:MAG: metallophosphoesterase [Nanoarchaeota archaeon]|nr:metallophosphoesterase [Nanoarchaeota archaeon]
MPKEGTRTSGEVKEIFVLFSYRNNMNKEIIKFCAEKGFLLDRDILELFNETSDIESIKLIIEKVKTYTHQNVLTKNLFERNKEQVNKFFLDLPEENKRNLEKLRIKLGLSIEISKEADATPSFKIEEPFKEDLKKSNFEKNINILSYTPKNNDKLEVKNFVNHFRARFNDLREILQGRFELDNLLSIDKISGSRRGISIIGMVYNKSVTKNKNIILDIEDLTGRIKILVSKSKEDLYKIAEEICLDSVLGFRCSGDDKILFANGIFFPDSKIPERKKSPIEEYALFIGDLHFGSKLFLKEGFFKFFNYLNGSLEGYDKDEIKKIKYLFIVGDLVAGIGVYPEQDKELEIVDLEEQFIRLARFLEKIPEHIKIIISPGNHDGVRLMEPQPVFDIKYAWSLHQLKNVIITENPCLLNIGAHEDFAGFDVLTYHGFSYPYYAGNIPELIKKKAMNSPEEIMKYLLKHRHLAPTHGSTQYYPHKEDQLIIKNVPDIFVSGHTHKCGVSYYNNILIISTSCWEAMTPYQEKFGNEPDHCKVPMLNLKTRSVKILDFE